MIRERRGRGLVDTNVIVHLADLPLSRLPLEMVISSVTLAELSAGPHTTDDPLERARRLSVLQHTEAAFDPLPFDAEAARVFGQVSAAVSATGRKPRGRFAGLMIAAVAITNRLPLYTTNPDDFTGLDEVLRVVAIPRP